jgi:hypothetical protein
MYLIRLLAGRPAKMRDGAGFKAPMKEVGQDDYTLFDNLPAGLTQHGGPGVEVKVVKSEAEAKKIQASMTESLEAGTLARAEYAKKVQAKIARQKAAAPTQAAAAPEFEEQPKEKARLAHTTTGQGRSRRRASSTAR